MLEDSCLVFLCESIEVCPFSVVSYGSNHGHRWWLLVLPHHQILSIRDRPYFPPSRYGLNHAGHPWFHRFLNQPDFFRTPDSKVAPSMIRSVRVDHGYIEYGMVHQIPPSRGASCFVRDSTRAALVRACQPWFHRLFSQPHLPS